MPKINSFQFGSLTVDNKRYDNDIIISWDGELTERDSSHTVSKSELIDLLAKGPEMIIIGTGVAGNVKIDKDAENFLKTKNVEVITKITPEAIKEFNNISKKKKTIAVIHVKC